MSEQEIKVPDLGGADEVEIIDIAVKKGDSVEEEDPILTLESDKASVDLPSPMAGKITKITVKEGDSVKEGDVVGMIDAQSASDDENKASDDDDKGDDKDEDKSNDKDESADEDDDKKKQDKKDEDDQSSSGQKASGKSGAKKSSGGERKETVKVPDLGGSENIPIIEMNVKAGDEVGEDDPLVTVESDKATVEIPSPYAGKITKMLVSDGDKISTGDDLLEMTIAGDDSDDGDADEAESDSEKTDEAAKKADDSKAGDEKGVSSRESDDKQETSSQPEGPAQPGAKVHAGPAVRKLAREFGADLGHMKGSGPKSRILKDDVQAYVKGQLQKTQESGAVGGTGIPGVPLPDFSDFGEVERESMSRMQVAAAANLHRSWLNVPHVTQHEEADITEMEAFRQSQKPAGEKRGVKMTPLPFLLKACARALSELPEFNVSLDMERKELIHKRYIHIGIAVDTPAGLMVPVIRDVDQKGLWELAEEAQELAAKARDKKLKPAEMKGACFSITSLGGIGGTSFTPIVNSPEVAILGLSKAAMKPVWDGEAFQPRLMLPLSLSYDHRAVNGADAARFTALLSDLLGDLRQLLL